MNLSHQEEAPLGMEKQKEWKEPELILKAFSFSNKQLFKEQRQT